MFLGIEGGKGKGGGMWNPASRHKERAPGLTGGDEHLALAESVAP